MGITDIFNKFGTDFLQLLPTSPFREFIDELNTDHLGILNWFVPINSFIKILGVWCASIALFYLYSVILRWLKIIGD